MDKYPIDFSSIDFRGQKNRYEAALKKIMESVSVKTTVSTIISRRFIPVFLVCFLVMFGSVLFLKYNLRSETAPADCWSQAYKYWKSGEGKKSDNAWEKINEMRVKTWIK
ncbi:MAG: hypothetical protein JXR95_16495 [Deltaproteobacteria bacterium]|nr:hypothetical protein [Deltaproteobacteria bacterium]